MLRLSESDLAGVGATSASRAGVYSVLPTFKFPIQKELLSYRAIFKSARQKEYLGIWGGLRRFYVLQDVGGIWRVDFSWDGLQRCLYGV